MCGVDMDVLTRKLQTQADHDSLKQKWASMQALLSEK